MAKDERTPDQIKEDALLEAQMIIDGAKEEAAGIKSAETKKDTRKKNPKYKMEQDKYNHLAVVQCKATPEAMFHKPGTEIKLHGKPAEMLIQKGELEFVEVVEVGGKDGSHAIISHRKPAPAETK